MFLKHLNKLIQNVSLASTLEKQDRRQGYQRRRCFDRRQEVRVGEVSERRVTPERRLNHHAA